MVIKDELQTALESLVDRFKDMCEKPKPTYSIDGQSVSWIELFKMLQDGIKELTELLVYFDPVEIRTSML